MNCTRTTVIAALALLAGVFPFQYALAQSPEVRAARDSVEATSAAPAETVKTHQTAIVSILDLTATELADVLGEDKLGAVIGSSDAGLAASARDLEQQLLMYQDYVGVLRRQVLHSGQTIKTLSAGAGDLKLWRERVYEPAVRQAFGVILVAQGNDVLLTAVRRLEKVAADVKKIQLARGTAAAPLLPLLENAKQRLASATKYQDEARALFAAEMQEFNSLDYEKTHGAPAKIFLSRGADGDFVCLAQAPAARAAQCRLAFKRSEGGYYLLKSSDGTTPAYAPGDISKVSGTLIAIDPLFSDDLVSGVVFIDLVNVAQSKAEAFSTVAERAESEPKEALGGPTVQSLIKLELDEITKAYQDDFFVMSKLAKKLLSQ